MRRLNSGGAGISENPAWLSSARSASNTTIGKLELAVREAAENHTAARVRATARSAQTECAGWWAGGVHRIGRPVLRDWRVRARKERLLSARECGQLSLDHCAVLLCAVGPGARMSHR